MVPVLGAGDPPLRFENRGLRPPMPRGWVPGRCFIGVQGRCPCWVAGEARNLFSPVPAVSGEGGRGKGFALHAPLTHCVWLFKPPENAGCFHLCEVKRRPKGAPRGRADGTRRYLTKIWFYGRIRLRRAGERWALPMPVKGPLALWTPFTLRRG